MPSFKVTMRVDIVRYVKAENKEEALDKVDTNDMMYELKYYGVNEEFIVEDVSV